jgi:hypothetical protein
VCTDLRTLKPFRVVTSVRGAVLAKAVRRRLSAASVIALIGIGAAPTAHADALARGTAAYSRGDYVRAARELSPLAQSGNARALGLLGFLYEHGFGEPQDYDAAADFYARGAVQGDPFAQAMLGLMYDKGHGVPLDFVLAYKWLNLAAQLDRDRLRSVAPGRTRFMEIPAPILNSFSMFGSYDYRVGRTAAFAGLFA